MSETDDLREALARDLTRAAASIESSRTGLGVNGGLVSALGRLTFQNLPLILDALAQVSALQAEVETLKAERTASQALAERARAERDAAVEALKQAANLCESEVQGVTLSTFIVNGVKIRDDQGQDRFLSTLEVSRYLRNLAHRIRARSAVTETKEGKNA